MRDELQLLKGNENLSRLLSHYASAGAADRETWQDRVMELEGADRQWVGQAAWHSPCQQLDRTEHGVSFTLSTRSCPTMLSDHSSGAQSTKDGCSQE